MTKEFIPHDLGNSARILRNDRREGNDILNHIDKEEFTDRLKNSVEICNKDEQTVTISKEHSTEKTKEQYRHLIDEEKTKSTEFRYGKITNVVIYRGENMILENGIEYRSVEEYLKSLR